MDRLELTIALPDWVGEFLQRAPKPLTSVEDRMRLVVDLARQNVERRTGGPFGAAVFDEDGRLVAPGVNVVVSNNCSILHAEVVAIALAQKYLGRYDMSDGGKRRYELIASTEPCTMCLGATVWSGVTRLVCGARDEDARRIGFDEGPKPPDWPRALAERGIEVVRDVLRQENAAVLAEYARSGGLIYNAERPGQAGPG
jgi:tRNA(Arg) A34 adenosine deaminase TadA